jgi:hypothetical protein
VFGGACDPSTLDLMFTLLEELQNLLLGGPSDRGVG